MNRDTKLFRIPGRFLLALVVAAFLFGSTISAQSPTPVVSQLFPSTIRAGSSSFTLTVLGSGFAAASIVQWNGANRITSYVNNGDLEASIPASDLVNPATVQITVVNPGPVVSNALTFTIVTANPTPVLTGLSPSSALAGGSGFVLTVFGEHFTEQSEVMWNGENRPTTLLDSETLVAEIAAADIESVGTAQVTVVDNAPGGGTSNPKTFTIRQFSNLYFPQVAVDGGYTTVFTLVNTGGETDTGSLVLTDPMGNPLSVSAAVGSNPPTTSSTFPISVPAGGVTIITATAPGAPGPTPKTGWARVDSTKGLLDGVASFQTTQGNVVTSVAGVLSAPPIDSGTIPVDNDAVLGRRAGFAIANPNSFDIHVKILVLDERGLVVGTALAPSELNPLRPGMQVAKFLDEYAPLFATFKGSMILLPDERGDQFVALALSFSQGLTSLGTMSVIPVLPGSTPLVR